MNYIYIDLEDLGWLFFGNREGQCRSSKKVKIFHKQKKNY